MPEIRFDAPDLPLVTAGFAFALLAIVTLEWRGGGSVGRRLARTLVRSALLLVVALALGQPMLVRDREAPSRVVLLLDRAARRIEGGESAATELLTRARLAARTGRFTLDVLSFDASVMRDAGPTVPSPTGPGARSRLSPALGAAGLLVSEGEAAAVVLASDGRADAAGAREAVEALKARGIPVRLVAIPAPVAPAARDPFFDSLDVPEAVNGPFAVRAGVQEPGVGATATLLVDGARTSDHPPVPLSPSDEVVFDGLVLPPGFHDVAVLVEGGSRPGAAPSPPIMRRALVRVAASPRVLVVSGGPTGGVLRRTLSSQGFSVSLAGASDAEGALAADSKLDLVVLDSDAIPAATFAFLDALLTRVRAGCGLIVAAGASADSWAALGRGPLAPILPLLPMDPPVTPLPPEPPPPAAPPQPKPPRSDDPVDPGPGLVAEMRPELALPISLLLVIDRSGSMEEEGKLGMAVRSAEEAAATLAPTDRVGVISFSDEPTLDCPMTSVSIATSVGLVPSLRASGDTDIFAALALAAKTMAPETNPIRHVLLLTDGLQSGSAYYTDLVTRMADSGMTLSTVGLGHDIAEARLKKLAAQGHGRFLFAPTSQDLPRVLIRDTKAVLADRLDRAKKARIDDPANALPPKPAKPDATPEAPTVPPPSESKPPPPLAPMSSVPATPLVRRRPHEALLGLEPANYPRIGMPKFAKPATPTSTILVRQSGEPVLAAGRAGLGRVIVLALPVTDPGFVAWQDATRLVSQAARSVTPPSDEGPVAVVRVTQGPDGDRLRVAVPDGIDPSAVAARIRVRRRGADGVVDASLADTDGGDVVYRLPPTTGDAATVIVESAGEDGAEPRALPPISYVPSKGPPTVRGSEPEALRRDAGQPLVAPDSADLFDIPKKRRASDFPLAAWLAALAAILLVIDVALHRRGRPS